VEIQPADLAPLVTAVGVAVAAATLVINGLRERRRKTLEACEKLLFDKELRLAISRITYAIRSGTYPPDDADVNELGSDRDLTTTIINVVESICLGVSSGLYDRKIAQQFLTIYVDLLSRHFLDPKSDQLVSRQFLGAALPELRKVFADRVPPVPSGDPTLTSQARGRQS
jgi:hypothetical protein